MPKNLSITQEQHNVLQMWGLYSSRHDVACKHWSLDFIKAQSPEFLEQVRSLLTSVPHHPLVHEVILGLENLLSDKAKTYVMSYASIPHIHGQALYPSSIATD